MNNDEREIVIHWDDFVGALLQTAEPNKETMDEIHRATQFLRNMLECDLSAERLIEIPDSQFQRAFTIANPYETQSEPLVEHAKLMFDEDSWITFAKSCINLPSACDPSIAEVFI